jgi:hypothetical protein
LNWKQDRHWWEFFSPGKHARAQRQLIQKLISYGANIVDSSATDQKKLERLDKKLASLNLLISEEGLGIDSFHQLKKDALNCWHRRISWQKDEQVAGEDYTPSSAKNEDHVWGTTRYWVCTYTRKKDELALLSALLQLSFDDDSRLSKTDDNSNFIDQLKNGALTKPETSTADDVSNIITSVPECSDQSLVEYVDTAARQFKPLAMLWLYYLVGKVSVLFTTLGGSLCAALVAMTVASAVFASPVLPLVAAGIAFTINMLVGVPLHRRRTPKTIVQIFWQGVIDQDNYGQNSSVVSNPGSRNIFSRMSQPFKQWQVWAPAAICSAFAGLYAALTYVAGMKLLGFLGAATFTAAVSLAVVDFIAMGCILFASAYKVCKNPKAWWQRNINKYENALEEVLGEHASTGATNVADNNKKKSLVYLQKTFIALSGLLAAAVMVWYFCQIGALVFPGMLVLGIAVATVVGLSGSGPGIIDAAFWLGARLTTLVADTVLQCPLPAQFMPLIAVVVFITIPFWGLGLAFYRGICALMPAKGDGGDLKQPLLGSQDGGGTQFPAESTALGRPSSSFAEDGSGLSDGKGRKNKLSRCNAHHHCEGWSSIEDTDEGSFSGDDPGASSLVAGCGA